jgi:hypothetical protein
MNLTWCVLALALAGTDDSQPTKPQPTSTPFTIEMQEYPHRTGARSRLRSRT